MKVAYVMSRFPHLSETFILREMGAMEAKGATIVVYPLLVQKQPVMHREAARWVVDLRVTTPWSLRAWGSVARLAFGTPKTFTRALATTIRENRSSPKFLLRALAVFPMAARAAFRMREEGVEHVHAHYATHPALFAWLVHVFTGLPYSVTVHAHDIFVDHSMLATKLNGAAFVAAISAFNRDYLAREVGEQLRERIHVIRCGIDPARYGEPHSGRHVEEPDKNRPFEIMCVGSLQPYKGHKYLVVACADLARRGLRFRCRIVGEGGERGSIERLIVELGLAGLVVLEGALPQDRVADMLLRADVYVQPSVVEDSGKMEGIPVALMEAMASGVPVIATRLSGVPELVRDKQTGVLVEPGDAQTLADAIHDVLSEPAAAELRAEAARSLVVQTYDLNSNVTALYQLMVDIRAGSQAPSPWLGREAPPWPA